MVDRLKGVGLLILDVENVLEVPPKIEPDWNRAVDPNDTGAAKPPAGNGVDVDEADGANADLKAEVEEGFDSAEVPMDWDFPKRLEEEGELTAPKPKPPKAVVGTAGSAPRLSVRCAVRVVPVVDVGPNRFDDGAFDGIGG